MKEEHVTTQREIEEATLIIKNAIKSQVGSGYIHSRDDIIRLLLDSRFDIVDVTDESISICASDAPELIAVPKGWLFSSRFRLSRSAYFSPIDVQPSETGKTKTGDVL